MEIIKALFFAVICFLCGYAQAQTYGYDVLALATYCDTYLKAPRFPAVSTLMGTFGNPLPCLGRALERGGLTDVQIDLINATCWRNKNCEKGEPRPDDLKAIRFRAAIVSELADKYPNTTFWLSPALEHDVQSSTKVCAMHAAARIGCPTCKSINSATRGASCPGIPEERHGNNVRAFSVSNDGESIFDANAARYRRSGTNFVFAWWNELNRRTEDEGIVLPPSKRTVLPTLEQFRRSHRLLFPPPKILRLRRINQE